MPAIIADGSRGPQYPIIWSVSGLLRVPACVFTCVGLVRLEGHSFTKLLWQRWQHATDTEEARLFSCNTWHRGEWAHPSPSSQGIFALGQLWFSSMSNTQPNRTGMQAIIICLVQLSVMHAV